MQINDIIKIIFWMQILPCLAYCAYAKGNMYPLDSKYIKYEELNDNLDKIVQINPDLAQKRIIGFSSAEYLPIYALQLGNKNASEAILIIGQHHGEEVIGVNIAFTLAEILLNGYSKNIKQQHLLQRYQIWIVPTLNPEGFRIVSSGILKTKRKNNRDTDNNKKLDLRTDGVDLNRNYPVFWDLDPETDTNSPFYKGSEPASENETKAIVELAQNHNFVLAIFLHSSISGAYNEHIYLPARINNSELFQKNLALARTYADATKKDYLKGNYEVFEGSTSEVGNARNFFFHRMKTPAFLVEIGGKNKRGQSIIHPPNKTLIKIVDKNVNALLSVFYKLDN
ncbi:MAG: M14 family metallopeptidase [Candidatus Cloacimonetes bacterium]|jgi:predicted deacylase|nr:M14 family metallopeptidase [Candidatus Cloacimonadota bacterium]MDD4677386.1 M14 family metallopeptidase [Candidatus Cloacimonadota bacterium]